MLHWWSFLEHSSKIVSNIIAHHGGQWCNYGLLPLDSPVTIQDARPKIYDTTLTLMSRMGHGACRLPCSLQRWPMLPLCKDGTMQLFDCWMGKTVNCWCSIDAYLRDILTVIVGLTIVCKMYTAIIDSHYIISMNNHLCPKPLRGFSFWAPIIHIIWAVNNIHPSRFSTFGQHLIAL
jgi:hypothetical protein